MNINDIKRNYSIVRMVLKRDLELCQCCGFAGSEVHHITPLVYGGLDHQDNMVVLCHFCHKYAPNTKEKFEEYMAMGGAKTNMIWGRILAICELKDIDFHTNYQLFKSLIKALRRVDVVNKLEKFNMKEMEMII